MGINANETKIVGLHWDKITDEIGVALPEKEKSETKCEVLKYLATIYNSFGIVSSVTLSGRVMLKESCDLKVRWHNTLQPDPLRRWKNWIKNLLAISAQKMNFSIKEETLPVNVTKSAGFCAVMQQVLRDIPQY